MAAEWLLDTLRHVWRLLESLEIRAALMGGMAMSVWQYARTTRDVDLLLGVDVSQAELLLARLDAAGLHPKNSPPFISVGELKILQLLFEPSDAFMKMQVDLLFADSPYHREAMKRRVNVVLPDIDFEVAVLTCEDIILHKLQAGRLIDTADVAALISLNHSSLDRDYLVRWLDALRLKSDFSEIWRKALPGQPFED